MLNVANVTKSYHRQVAVSGANLHVPPGNVAVLLGPNGAGKSTLIKCIAGLLRFTGSVEIAGHDCRTTDAKREIGYIPEMPALYEMLTVQEHLEFIARAYDLRDWQTYAESLLDRLELADKRLKLGKELSKGMQQKVSIACALLPRPKLCLFDEPMVGLDPHAIKELKNIMAELRDDGCAMLVSTHMIDTVAELWDVAYIMKQSNIVSHLTRAQEAGGETLEDLFFRVTEGDAV